MKSNESAIREFKKGLKVFSGFHWGRDVDEIRKVIVDPPPDVLVHLGLLKTVAYETRKLGPDGDHGDPVIYVHSFDSPFPILCSSQDSKGLWIIGGNFRVEDRGIVG